MITRIFLKALLLFTFFFINQAHSNKQQWDNLTNDEYISQRIICQSKIESFYSDLRKQLPLNKSAKYQTKSQLSNEVLDQKVDNSIKMEQVLSELYQVQINNDSLQAELDRMVSNSKDVANLKALFQVLNNDPNTIAECISRPYLVENNIRKYYQSFDKESESLKETINEARLFPTNKNNQDVPESTVVVYKYLMNNNASVSKDILTDFIELNSKDFQNKISELIELSKKEILPLQENSHYFYTERLLKATDTLIEVEVESWEKQLFDEWWFTVEKKLNTNRIRGIASELNLPDFTLQKNFKSQSKLESLGEWQTFIPDPRSNHTAIWTGSEMIIWGGVNGGGEPIFYNNGYKYNPITDSWIPINLDNAPKARAYHSTIWTGSKMVVWGGNDYTDYFQDGKSYDPVDDSWSDLNDVNAPSPRSYHQAFYTGRYMIIWDGFARGFEPDSGHIYDFLTNNWFPITDENAPTSRDFSSAIWTGARLIVWGGRDRSGASNGSLDTGAIYNLAQNKWEPITQENAPSGRYRHNAVWTGDKMMIWGSVSSASDHRYGGVYDPNTDTWVQMSVEGQPRTSSYNTLIWTGTEMITWGGHNGSSNEITGGVYNPELDSWRLISKNGAPIRRASHSAVWTGNEMIIWGGGYNTGGRYNPVNNSWILTNEPPGAPNYYPLNSAIWTGAEMIVWGGQVDYSIGARTGGSYNPITDQWLPTRTNDAPTPRYLHTAVWTGSDMIIWGGGTWETGLNSGGIYNPVTNRWSQVSLEGAPASRINHTSIWTGDEMIVWGGRVAGLNANTGAKYNPVTNTWTPTSELDAPLGRRYHTATWTGNEMIIWGGESIDNNSLLQNSLYYPETDSWKEIEYQQTIPYPTAKHTAVWTGDSLLTWGGTTSLSSVTGFKYDPVTNLTEKIIRPDFLGPKERHTAIWTGTEMIVWGGDGEYFPGRYSLTRNGGKYNPVTKEWTETSLVGAPPITANHQAVWTGTSMLVWSSGTLRNYYPDGKSDYVIDKQISGNWYNPEQSGHGLQLEIIEQENGPAVLAAWYTYFNGSPVWLIGVGEINNNHVEIDMNITTGTGFPQESFDPNDVEVQHWGKINLALDTAATGRLSWSSRLFGNISGGFNIERLTQISTDNSSQGIRSCHSGSWFNPNQNGHGLMVNVLDNGPDKSMLLAWYTYLGGEQYWLLGTGPINGNSAQISAISGSGAEFPPKFNSADLNLSNWGELSFTLVNNNNAIFEWESNLNQFPSDSINVSRLTQLVGYPCD